jgi:exodeoxyribonuclease V
MQKKLNKPSRLVKGKMAYTLSNDQAEALLAIGRWYKDQSSPFITLGGYAGTGKTTLIAYLRQALSQYDEDVEVAFCAFTGKAARVLSERLRQHKVPSAKDSVSTIHSLIYSAETNKDGQVVGWLRKDELPFSLIIVDEASMVDQRIWEDLLSFNVPVLAVGDHGQLPPVSSNFNLMAAPHIRLERIFRQQEDSAIIEVATLARTSGHIPAKQYSLNVQKLNRQADETGAIVEELLQNWTPDTLILCGYNHTRVKLNQDLRRRWAYESAEPQPGDRLVCLRNNRYSKVYNGMTGTLRSIEKADDNWYEAMIELDNEDFAYYGFIYRPQFGEREAATNLPLAPNDKPGDLFDFGYALTVHKAQGSQAPGVLLFEERFSRMSDEDWRRWLYTGVTRAIDKLTVVG